MGRSVEVSKGLDDVVVGSSAISYVGGETGELVYRGFDISELVPGTPFESVAHLLIAGEPPASDPAPEIVAALRGRREVPRGLVALADAIPPAFPPLEAMRTLISAMGDGHYGYPPRLDDGFDLIAWLPTLLARQVRRSQGRDPLEPRPDLSHVANYWWMLHGTEPDPPTITALEGYFDLLADHGMNASTFALLTVISTQSDLMSAATAALGALKGPAHGGAPSRVSDMLDAVGTPENAESWIAERLARRERLMGFGHRAYKVEDPRAVLLKRLARGVASPARFALAEAVEREALAALRRERPGQRLFTNVEYYSAVLLEAVGLPRELFTPTFAVARTVGWTAHALEQASDNRLIRPDVKYTGPPSGRRWPRPRAGRG